MNKYQRYIEACMDCAIACNHCASSCLNEDEINSLANCIRLDLECASVCITTAKLMSSDSEFSTHISRLCADICEACATECEKHEMEHCKKCAMACRYCAEQCESLVLAWLRQAVTGRVEEYERIGVEWVPQGSNIFLSAVASKCRSRYSRKYFLWWDLD